MDQLARMEYDFEGTTAEGQKGKQSQYFKTSDRSVAKIDNALDEMDGCTTMT